VELLKAPKDIVGRQMAAAEVYHPKPYSGRIYMFRAESRTELLDDQTMGWGKILPDLEISDVPGDHGTINTGENVKILAGKLTKILSNAANRRDVEPTTLVRRHATSSQPRSQHVWR
jgi:thioesterase domain-containing protein